MPRRHGPVWHFFRFLGYPNNCQRCEFPTRWPYHRHPVGGPGGRRCNGWSGIVKLVLWVLGGFIIGWLINYIMNLDINSIMNLDLNVEGMYQFKVTVSSSNPVSYGEAFANVTVFPKKRILKPPVAVVAPEAQTVNLPTNKAVIDGSTSTDDNWKVASFNWEIVTSPVGYESKIKQEPTLSLDSDATPPSRATPTAPGNAASKPLETKTVSTEGSSNESDSESGESSDEGSDKNGSTQSSDKNASTQQFSIAKIMKKSKTTSPGSARTADLDPLETEDVVIVLLRVIEYLVNRSAADCIPPPLPRDLVIQASSMYSPMDCELLDGSSAAHYPPLQGQPIQSLHPIQERPGKSADLICLLLNELSIWEKEEEEEEVLTKKHFDKTMTKIIHLLNKILESR